MILLFSSWQVVLLLHVFSASSRVLGGMGMGLTAVPNYCHIRRQERNADIPSSQDHQHMVAGLVTREGALAVPPPPGSRQSSWKDTMGLRVLDKMSLALCQVLAKQDKQQ